MARRLISHPLKNKKRFATAANRHSISEFLPQVPYDYQVHLPLRSLASCHLHMLSICRFTQHPRYNAFLATKNNWRMASATPDERWIMWSAYPDQTAYSYHAHQTLGGLEKIAETLLRDKQSDGLKLLALDTHTGYVCELKFDGQNIERHRLFRVLPV